MAVPLSFGELRKLARDFATAGSDDRPLAVDGVLADVLRRELIRGGDPAAVRVGGPERAVLYVRVVGDGVTADDEAKVRRARRAKVPVVLVAGTSERIPLVPATDVVVLRPGTGFPVEEIAAAVGRRLGEAAIPLAARLPVVRGPVCSGLVASFARKNGLVGAAVFVPGVDLPILTLNQLRLVLRIALAHGERSGAEVLPEVLATLGAAYGFRAVARRLLGAVPLAGWAVKGGVAYAGTRAIGEAAIRLSELRAPATPGAGGAEGLMPRPVAASPGGS